MELGQPEPKGRDGAGRGAGSAWEGATGQVMCGCGLGGDLEFALQKVPQVEWSR